jgi:hypothetical protein
MEIGIPGWQKPIQYQLISLRVNKDPMFSCRKIMPRAVPTTGWAKKVREATPASRIAKAVFQRYIARAVEIIPRNKIPR